MKCYEEILRLVEDFLPGDRESSHSSNPTPTDNNKERLEELVLKVLIYESCLKYYQAKATGSQVH